MNGYIVMNGYVVMKKSNGVRIREEAREERMERLFETECDDPEYAEMECWNTH